VFFPTPLFFRYHLPLTLIVQVQEASDEVMQKKEEVLKDIAQHKQQIREAKGEPIREAKGEPIIEAKKSERTNQMPN
jgi:hypothetical protein